MQGVWPWLWCCSFCCLAFRIIGFGFRVLKNGVRITCHDLKSTATYMSAAVAAPSWISAASELHCYESVCRSVWF